MIKKYSYFAFFTFGFFAMILPSALPIAMKEFRMDYSQSGYIMIIGTAGYIAGSLICALFAHKTGLKMIAVLGAFFSSVGLFYFFFVRDFINLSFANFIANIGMGFIEIGIGSLIGSLKEENVSGTLNRVNALFAFGAFMSPFIVSFIVNYKMNWQIAYLIGTFFAILSLAISLKIKEVKSEKSTDELKINVFNPFFIFIYIMIGIYVGYEATYSSWVTTFLTNFRHIDVALAALSSSAFWIGMFLGRLFASYIKVKATVWLIFIVAASLTSVIFSVAFANYYVAMIFVLLSGLFFASTYPTIQLMLIEKAGGNIGNLMGVFVFFVGIGATLAQWMVSAASNLWGILVGFSLIPFMIFAELALSIHMKAKAATSHE
ncbi:MAG: MFS transporter [Thermotogae bacterium]|jgi:fucose permease|nr:MFS transporter [Thermotogota bacterium]